MIACLIVVGTLYLIFNNYGILKYVRAKSQLEELNTKIMQLQDENRKLEAEIDSLKSKVPAKIEKVAREKFNMIRANEKKIEFKVDE
jgi:cell division protein FtsL